MEQREFRLSQLEVSEFFLGWSALASTPLSPLQQKYERLTSELERISTPSQPDRDLNGLQRAQRLMREITLRQDLSRNTQK